MTLLTVVSPSGLKCGNISRVVKLPGRTTPHPEPRTEPSVCRHSILAMVLFLHQTCNQQLACFMYKIHLWNLSFGNISLTNLRFHGYCSHGKDLSEEQRYSTGTNLVDETGLWGIDTGFWTLSRQSWAFDADRAVLFAGKALGWTTVFCREQQVLEDFPLGSLPHLSLKWWF